MEARIAGIALACLATQAGAATLSDCRGIADSAARLACYDAIDAPAPAAAGPASATPASGSAPVDGSAPVATKSAARATISGWLDRRSQTDSLAKRWELEPGYKDGIFKVKPYEPVFALPLVLRQQVNVAPCTPNPANCSAPGSQSYKRVSTSFQLSLKTKMAQDVFAGNADLWFGFTTRAYWQAYDTKDSSPFREADYKPAAWVTWPLDVGPTGIKLRMANLGFVHESNGQTDPLSRSWNRVFAQLGFEAGDFSLILSPWYRIPESAAKDNNPDITEYMGHMETLAVYAWRGNLFSARLRNPLRTGGAKGSYGEATWSFPIAGNLHGYVQGFVGHGESLQNYNFFNRGIGLGISLVDWL